MDIEALNTICGMATNIVQEYLHDQVRDGIEKLREEGALEEGGLNMGFGTIDMGQAIGDACLSMFIFGWETHAQYGKER